jgi:superfamily II DNA/RNA helicase
MQVDPLMLVKKAEIQEVATYVPTHQFSDFALDGQIRHNISDKGYTQPTPIQDMVIPEILAGHDVIGLAATGTGKTAAFLLPLINKVMQSRKVSNLAGAKSGTQADKVLIVTPTRELAVQIIEEGKAFARQTGCFFTLIIGGVDMNRQVRDLRRNPQFVVGTPGRIKDLSERRELNLRAYGTIVLDEVDRMLDMGFVRDITTIVEQLATPRHSLFFSATMNPKAQEIAARFLHEPRLVEIARQAASANVDQDVVRVSGRNKVDVLHDLLIQPGFEKVIIFGRTKHGVEKLSRHLNERGFSTAAIHGNKNQNQRQRALTAFKQNAVKILLATDVAARGIDVDSVTHVINYELPETYDDYIHRIGRTGRADKTGVALTFID